MNESKPRRKLAAILAADVAGYTCLMEKDTDGSVAAWQDASKEVIKPQFEKQINCEVQNVSI